MSASVPSLSADRSQTLLDRFVLFALAAALVLLRSHVRAAALESDECNYLYIAARLLAGDRLYVDVWDHQPPGVFVMFAALARMFGDGPATLRLTATVASVACLAAIYDAVRCGFSRRAAMVAAAVYVVGSVHPIFAGEGGNREIYMNALNAIAMWLLVRRPAINARSALLAGACFALASWFKPVVAFQWFAVAMVLVAWPPPARDGRRPLGRWSLLGCMTLGPAVLWAATFGYFLAVGRFDAFFDAVFRFNVGYSGAGEGSLSHVVEFFGQKIGKRWLLGPAWPVWVCAGAGVVWAFFARGEDRVAWRLWAAYAVGSVLAVALPGRFWPHYYLLVWPAAVVLASAVAVRVAERVTLSKGLWPAVIVGAALVVVPAMRLYADYLSVAPTDISALRYGERMEWDRDQGERFAKVVRPDECIYVWGSDVGVYYYGGVRCASRYTMTTPLQKGQNDYERRSETMIADLERNRPAFVLLVEPMIESLDKFLKASYVLIGRDPDPEDAARTRALVLQRADLFRPDVQLPWPRP